MIPSKFDLIFEEAVFYGIFKTENQAHSEALKSVHLFGFNMWLQKEFKKNYIEENYEDLVTNENFDRYLKHENKEQKKLFQEFYLKREKRHKRIGISPPSKFRIWFSQFDNVWKIVLPFVTFFLGWLLKFITG